MIIKIKNIFLKIIYVFVIGYLLIFIPSLWGHKPLVVISGSMEPTLKVGSILYYHSQDIIDFNQDDILVYKAKAHIISHRIVSQSETGFMTKGDANNTIDSNEVLNKQVLGKGTNWCIPYVGYFADYMYNHKYIIYISIIILIFDLCNEHFHERKKKAGAVSEKNN